MRQWDQVKAHPGSLQTMARSDHLGEPVKFEKTGDGKLAHRQNEPGTKQDELGIEPGHAAPDLLLRRDAIPSLGCFAGKTAAHRGNVDLPAERILIDPAGLLEPPEQGFSRRSAAGPS